VHQGGYTPTAGLRDALAGVTCAMGVNPIIAGYYAAMTMFSDCSTIAAAHREADRLRVVFDQADLTSAVERPA
jgi:hypothetical protein